MRIKTSRVPKELQKITRVGVKFFCANFLHPRTQDRLELIHVKFLDNVKGDGLAWCGPDDAENLRPVEFTVEFNGKYRDMRIREYMITLFHELTHMRQYATGQLRDLNDGTTIWRGEKYGADINYWMQPWEVDARGMEQAVYQLFIAQHPEYGLKRYAKKYNGRHRSGWVGEPKKTVKNQ